MSVARTGVADSNCTAVAVATWRKSRASSDSAAVLVEVGSFDAFMYQYTVSLTRLRPERAPAITVIMYVEVSTSRPIAAVAASIYLTSVAHTLLFELIVPGLLVLATHISCPAASISPRLPAATVKDGWKVDCLADELVAMSDAQTCSGMSLTKGGTPIKHPWDSVSYVSIVLSNYIHPRSENAERTIVRCFRSPVSIELSHHSRSRSGRLRPLSDIQYGGLFLPYMQHILHLMPWQVEYFWSGPWSLSRMLFLMVSSTAGR